MPWHSAVECGEERRYVTMHGTGLGKGGHPDLS